MGADSIRDVSRTQAPYAGTFPKLREIPRRPIMARMPASDVIDYPRLRRLVRDRVGGVGQPSPRKASLAATRGKNEDMVRNLLDGTDSSVDAVFGLCDFLKIPLPQVIKAIAGERVPARTWLTVTGYVQAGSWREPVDDNPDEMFQVEVEELPIYDGQHGLLVRGHSMNKIFPPATVLRCVDLILAGTDIEIELGDYVIAERKRAGLRELTCKRLQRAADGSWELASESTLPEFRDPIPVGLPSEGYDDMGEDETRVRAIVIDAYLPLPRRPRRPLPDEG